MIEVSNFHHLPSLMRRLFFVALAPSFQLVPSQITSKCSATLPSSSLSLRCLNLSQKKKVICLNFSKVILKELFP